MSAMPAAHDVAMLSRQYFVVKLELHEGANAL